MPTLICLVSDQHMQNVIPILERSRKYNQMVLIVSAGEDGRINPRFASAAADIEVALAGRVVCQLYPVPVDPMDPKSAYDVCKQVMTENNGPEKVAINLTGGTKPMSIGTNQAGFEENACMLYVDTDARQIFFHQGSEVKDCKFDLERLPVSLVLTAHGYKIDSNETIQKAFRPVDMELAEFILARRPKSLSAWLSLREFLIKKKDSNTNRSIDEHYLAGDPVSTGLVSILEEHGLACYEKGKLIFSEEGFKIIEGGWLESYVYIALKQSRLFTDVSNPLVVKKGNVKNELDVCCTLAGKLGIIECKSGRTYKAKKTQGGMKKRRVVTDASQFLNRLNALKDTISGTFGEPFLVVVDQQMGSGILQRAKEYTSRIIYANELAEVEKIAYEKMMKKGR